KDSKKIMADVVFELGNYYRYYNDYRSNGTVAFHTFMWATYAVGEEDPYNYFYDRHKNSILSDEKYVLMMRFLDERLYELDLADMNISDGMLIKDELKQSVFLVKLITELN